MSEYIVAPPRQSYSVDHSACFVNFDQAIADTVSKIREGIQEYQLLMPKGFDLKKAQAEQKFVCRALKVSMFVGIGIGTVGFLLGRLRYMTMAGIWTGIMGYGLFKIAPVGQRIKASLKQHEDQVRALEEKLPEHFFKTLGTFAARLNDATVEGLRRKVKGGVQELVMQRVTLEVLDRAVLALQTRVATAQ